MGHGKVMAVIEDLEYGLVIVRVQWRDGSISEVLRSRLTDVEPRRRA